MDGHVYLSSSFLFFSVCMRGCVWVCMYVCTCRFACICVRLCMCVCSLCETLPPHPPTLSQSSNHVFFLAGRWSTSGWGGNAHFFTYTQEYYDRGRQEKIERQTNNKAWGYQEQREVCNTTCICIPDSRYMDYR